MGISANCLRSEGKLVSSASDEKCAIKLGVSTGLGQPLSVNIIFCILLVASALVGFFYAPKWKSDDEEKEDKDKSAETSTDNGAVVRIEDAGSSAEGSDIGGEGGKSLAAKLKEKKFRSFQFWFLICWYLCAMGDWFQGPNGYEMIVDVYGYNFDTFTGIQVAGFMSGILLNSVVGTVADWVGRKVACVAYCVFNGILVFLYLFRSKEALYIGQVSNGIATRILFTCFEAWYVAQHFIRGYSGAQLGNTLSWVWFGFPLMAILAGGLSMLIKKISGSCLPLRTNNDETSKMDVPLGLFNADGLNDYKPVDEKSAGFSMWMNGLANVFIFDLGILILAGVLIAVFWKNEKPSEEEDAAEEEGKTGVELADLTPVPTPVATTGEEDGESPGTISLRAAPLEDVGL